ncbi:MAG: hypothetical protein A2666_01955 [Parcubacteria group bacterium RIFCSPHIGHO2_01_FULL_47_10b]|nr:MAG: hypothetical protein A2666_01955 [Parcubacteria group bacterium RIFCSPHIGHO2_01_FULL_47_10b]
MHELLIIIALSIVPISELRGALIYAVTQHIPLSESLLPAILANVLIVLVIYPQLEWLYKACKRFLPPLGRFGDWVFEHTRRKHSASFERFKEFALVILVAIPLPLTGGWTGMAAAFVFGIKQRNALILISSGVALSGLIMAALIQLGYTIF